MIDVVSGDEPPVELGDDHSRNFGVPHSGWFFTSVILQLVVLLFIGVSKLHAMSPATVVKVEALTGYVSRDKFRGNYITDVIFNADAAGVLPDPKAQEVVLIFETDKTVSALGKAVKNWHFVRIEPSRKTGVIQLERSAVALRAKVSPSRFQSGKQMISINTAPFFIAEDTANSLTLRDSSRTPSEFDIAIDKDGNAKLVSVDTKKWL